MTVRSLSTFRLAWVQAYLAFEQYGSASAAAREIGCNQTTVSRSVKELGAFLGGPLFEGENALELTPLGKAFLPKAIELADWVRACRMLKSELATEEASKKLSPSLLKKLKRVHNYFLVGIGADISQLSRD